MVKIQAESPEAEHFEFRCLILEFNPIRKPATLRSERYCYGDKEHRADPEEARRVVCSRSDFTLQNCSITRVLSATLLSLVNKIINKKKKIAKTDGDPLRSLLNVSPSNINEGGQSEKTGV
ncbi:hypothetical protein ALC53_11416 [Atta colombica]|uniref:Uncharacterized protein n=1 Tax=Atta colombica TaxID=520822 RepID=A0A195B183_9HYME|nr:hypothetical protein ALC53_11416 [Atta colombica]